MKKAATKKKPVKRPPKETRLAYRRRVISIICAAISTSDRGLGRICEAAKVDDKTFPHKCTVLDWIRESEEFANQYARAKEDQADHIFDQIIEIADDSSEDEIFIDANDTTGASAKRIANNEFIQRSKLRVDARKWIASKLLPRKYGDKIEVDNKHSGTIGQPELNVYVNGVISEPNTTPPTV